MPFGTGVRAQSAAETQGLSRAPGAMEEADTTAH
jgi:hypothetical protein